MFLLKKIPKIDYIIAVYAVIAAITFTWSMIQFFWNLPSWFYFSSVGEIFVIFTYMMTFNLIEGLLVLFFIIVLFTLMPSIFVSGQFITKAVLVILTGFGFLIYRNLYFPTKALSGLTTFQWVLILGLQFLILIVPFNKFPAFCGVVENLADRFIVFIYITVSLSILSVIVVLTRNLL
jgi:hypothetical protein